MMAVLNATRKVKGRTTSVKKKPVAEKPGVRCKACTSKAGTEVHHSWQHCPVIVFLPTSSTSS